MWLPCYATGTAPLSERPPPWISDKSEFSHYKPDNFVIPNEYSWIRKVIGTKSPEGVWAVGVKNQACSTDLRGTFFQDFFFFCEKLNHWCPMNIRGIFFSWFFFYFAEKYFHACLRLSEDMHGINFIFFVISKFSTFVRRTCVETYETPILVQFFSKFRGFSRSHRHGLNSRVQF